MSTTAIAQVPADAAGADGASRGRRRNRNRNRALNAPEGQNEGQANGELQTQRGGRSGRGRGRGRGGHSLVPSQVLQTMSSENSASTTAPAPARGGYRGNGGPERGEPGRGGSGRGGSGRGGSGRGGSGRGGAQRFPQRTAGGGRQFGGQLTTEDDAQSAASASLQADAPEFEPGRPLVGRKPRAPREKQPQLPKSTAPDIATRTHEDIDNGHYECAICTEDIKRRSKGVWSCRTCWTVFHLGCIKKWSTNEGSAAARQQAQDGEAPPPRQWRCPGCNLPKDVLPKNFSCWCEKELDPKPVTGLPPFSCGQTCSRPRILPKKCPHPCGMTCHAGPCPPCSLMGPTQYCFCGSKSVTRKCVDTDYEHGWSCGEVCGELLACGEHRCSRPCHEGPCGACDVRVPARCYCGQIQKDIMCCDREATKHSRQRHTAADGTATIEEWTGTFKCPNVCGRLYDCGKHACKQACHRQNADSAHCPRSPDVVTHCPCGKTRLSEISDARRESCEDPVPNCSKPCNNTLDCGHKCKQPCHQGECRPCMEIVTIACRCGRNSFSTVCHQGTEEAPQCMRICRVALNCGRHECGEHCCAGERKAAERQATRRKPRPLNSSAQRPGDNFEAEHICTRACGRQLKCGNPEHRCQELCHKGPCGTCRDAIFDEISCNCGRTVLQPPLPCGTRPPLCRFPCERPKNCGHPQVGHNCHGDEEDCPKCPYLTTKSCLCGKNVIKNQPCWLSEVRCGEVCGRTLRCGIHKCQKQCHRGGECEEPCKQTCGKELSACGHPDMAPCHFPQPCKEDRSCQHKIIITCECQRIKQETKCNASKSSEGNSKKTLKCDEECARLERNRKLALALNVDPEHETDHVPYSDITLNLYVEHSTWAAAHEKRLRLFAADDEEKRLRFKPMPKHQRKFIHYLAEDFGFDTESMDPEPHRHVAVFKTPKFVMAPMKTLAECARTRQVQRPIPAAPAPAPLRPKPSNTTGDPYNSFLILNPRFALTIEEVGMVIKNVLPQTNFPLEFDISFLPIDAVSLKPPLAARLNIPEREMQTMLESVKTPLSQAFTAQKVGSLQLARTDASLNVLRKESDIGPGSGWSQVAASRGIPSRQVQRSTPFGNKGGFAVLSLSSKKKKEKPAPVVDDWEAAEEEEEEKEEKDKASGANSGTVSEDDGPSRPRSRGLADASADEASISTKPGELLGRWSDLDDV